MSCRWKILAFGARVDGAERLLMIHARAHVGDAGAVNAERVAYTFAIAFRRAAQYCLIRSLMALRAAVDNLRCRGR